ncbi:Ring3 protein, partial [Haematococcus lacustris]
MSHKLAWPFNTPVDTRAYPDYLKVVVRPMDLLTIKSKLESGGQYRDPKEVWADVQLVFSNAKQFNPPGSDVHVMAQTVLDYASEKYEKMLAQKVADAETQAQRDE